MRTCCLVKGREGGGREVRHGTIFRKRFSGGSERGKNEKS